MLGSYTIPLMVDPNNFKTKITNIYLFLGAVSQTHNNYVQNYVQQIPTIRYKSIIWQFHAHTIPAKQRVLKLNHCSSSIYSRISDANPNIRGKFTGGGTLIGRQQTLNLKSCFPAQLWSVFPSSYKAVFNAQSCKKPIKKICYLF